MSSPLEGHFASARGSPVHSSPLPGVYMSARSDNVPMKTHMMVKPYTSAVERDTITYEAQNLSQALYTIPSYGIPPYIQLHDTGATIMIQLTGSKEWVTGATAISRMSGWRMKGIRINDTVEVKPYLTRANYMSEAPLPLDDRPLEYAPHGPHSVRPSWMNLGIPAQREGGVSYTARYHNTPLKNIAKTLSERRARATGRHSPYVAYTPLMGAVQGMHNLKDAAGIAYEEGERDGFAVAARTIGRLASPVSNAAGGRRKTRKNRKTRRLF
jgi:hypothetical protein